MYIKHGTCTVIAHDNLAFLWRAVRCSLGPSSWQQPLVPLSIPHCPFKDINIHSDEVSTHPSLGQVLLVILL